MKRITTCLMAAALSLTAGCASSPTGRQQLMLLPASQVNEMGVQAFDQMRHEGKFLDAPVKRRYVRCIVDALLPTLPEPWNTADWEVQIVDDDTANAFAVPGARIGVNDGILKLADNQDLLAVVLGHELAHVVAQHGAERISDNLAVMGGVLAVSAAAASRGKDSDNVIALLGVGATVGILLPFSRTQESEADVLGQRYMAAAGFDPRAAETLWQRMSEKSGGATPTFLSTHPASGQRAQRLARQAQELMPVYQQARAGGRTPNCRL